LEPSLCGWSLVVASWRPGIAGRCRAEIERAAAAQRVDGRRYACNGRARFEWAERSAAARDRRADGLPPHRLRDVHDGDEWLAGWPGGCGLLSLTPARGKPLRNVFEVRFVLAAIVNVLEKFLCEDSGARCAELVG
jgi:hypothetical protein